MRARSRTRVERFAFGGVAFEMLAAGAEGRRLELGPELARLCAMPAEGPVVAHATCSLAFEAYDELSAPRRPNHVQWRLEGGALTIDVPRVRACARRLGATRYAVSSSVDPSPEGALAFLLGVSGAVVSDSGGLVLHAAVADLDGRAVVLLGPSGAGKSTAATLLPGARIFADDQVALVPGTDGWTAWALPGGTAAPMPRSRRASLPVACVLRVRRESPVPRLDALAGVSAVFAVRESVESADCEPHAQDAMLDAVMALVAQVPVGSVHTVLGEPWTEQLGEFLARRGR